LMQESSGIRSAKIKVFRSTEDGGSRYDTFDVDIRPGITVLAVLFKIQDELDPTLAFRYSCRSAVCGSCAMLINKFPSLACRTQLVDLLGDHEPPELKPYPAIVDGEDWVFGQEVLVEPLPHLPVIKDLVVNMGPFFKAYEAVKPYFQPVDKEPEKERIMMPEDVKELENYTNCILCGSCYGACPVEGADSPFLGPAAMAKLYRFMVDPREGQGDMRLQMGARPDGWTACKFHANCFKVCPKGVPPNLGIGKARAKMMEGSK
jgi:succinate dehydrogenase/fumarate reductase iron-sulfur protein